MKILKFFVYAFFVVATPACADSVLFQNTPVQDGLRVYEMSDVFAEIYEKLDDVKWAGKSINVAIEGLEHLNPNAHIAATDERIILVWKDEIVGNFPRPVAGDWRAFGEITTALMLKMRERDAFLHNASESEMYQMVVESLLRDIDEKGRYVYSESGEYASDGQIMTHTGIVGFRDERGNLRVSAVFRDSPADVAGIKAEDLVVGIDGKKASDLSDIDFVNMISGYNSGTAKLRLATPSGDKDVVIRRATIVTTDADIIHRNSGTGGAILEIVIHNITDGAVSIVAEALKKYQDTTGIVLDLRTAFGADERVAAKLAGLFVGQKPVMRIVQTAMDEVEVVPGGDAMTDVPVVVLVTNMTRGSAEGVAAAFYDNKRGVLVGTPTAGIARVSSLFKLNNGGSLEIMNKSIKSGTGRVIDGRGVFPIVCMSNIRSSQQENAFFLNVINNEFNYQDLNLATDVPVKDLRRGCPTITSGADEDALAAALSAKILTDKIIYNRLIAE